MQKDVKELSIKIWSQGIRDYRGNLDYLRGVFLIKNLFDIRDHYTYIHSIHVSRYSYLIGRELNMNEKELRELTLTALLHDIGKSRISIKILSKRNPLTFDEYEKIKKHVFFGANIVRKFKVSQDLGHNILFHHERWDGKGYPFGLKTKEIPLMSRIVTIADSFDAMTSDRSYQSGISLSEAIKELQENAGKQFDPELVDIFINMLLNRKDLENKYEQNVQAG